ncbi:MAG: flagellar hook-associated protein 3 FlgL [Pirellulaceae bacterium]|jgi:flagellar hook-associated protein 3 FlgL
MASLYPVPAGRVSDALLHTRLLLQTQFDQQELLRLQDQISTGRQIARTSDDPAKTVRALNVQRILEQKTQSQVNLATNQEFVRASESAISHISGLLISVRGLVVNAANLPTTDAERDVAAIEIDRVIQQLVTIGNQEYRGQQLFGGSLNQGSPFEFENGFVKYVGNEGAGRNYADVNQLLEHSLNGNAVFGALSDRVVSSSNYSPSLTEKTRLADLRSGFGIALGEIDISDGTNSSRVDLTGAETLGDVVRRIEANSPEGRTISVRLSGRSLVVEIDQEGGGKFTIRDVDHGLTAAHLGIARDSNSATLPIESGTHTAVIRRTTKIADVLGFRPEGVLRFVNDNNDIRIGAKLRGEAYNGYAVNVVRDGDLQAASGIGSGDEFVRFEPNATSATAAITFSDAFADENDIILTAIEAGSKWNDVEIVFETQAGIGAAPVVNFLELGGNKTLTITIDDTANTSVNAIKSAIDNYTFNGEQIFSAADDDSAGGGNGSGSIVPIDGVVGNTGSSGGDANSFFLHVANTTTASEAVESLNNDIVFSEFFSATIDDKDNSLAAVSGNGLLQTAATVLAAGAGVEPDLSSGLRIVNGGEVHIVGLQTAETIEDVLNILNSSDANVFAEIDRSGSRLNIRSRLSGASLQIGENGGRTATDLGIRSFQGETTFAELNEGRGVRTIAGTDFIIRRNDGVELKVDLSSARTIQDVLDLINDHVDNQDADRAVVAQLATIGNGIQLVDDNPVGDGSLTIIAAHGSAAARDLGLVRVGESEASPTESAPPSAASVDINFDPDNDPPTPQARALVTFAFPNNTNTAIQFTAANEGTQFNGIQIEFSNIAASGNQAIVSYDPVGKRLTVDIDPAATTAQTIVNAVNSASGQPLEALLDLTTDPTNTGLGLIAAVGVQGTTIGGTTPLTGTDEKNQFIVRGKEIGPEFNGVQIELVNSLATGDQALIGYDDLTRVLTVDVDPAATTAQTVVDAINAHGFLDAELDQIIDPLNDGSGLIIQTGVIGTLAGGAPNPVAEPAVADVNFAFPDDSNTSLLITAPDPGTAYNDVQVIFTNTAVAGAETVLYDNLAATLTIGIQSGVSTANNILAAINGAGTFSAELNLATDLTNDGTGIINTAGLLTTFQGGSAETYTSNDVNQVQVDGVFNTLIRLRDAIKEFDIVLVERLMLKLDVDFERVNGARAELGAREANLQAIGRRISDEETDLRSTLSLELDTDLVAAISSLQQKQVSVQASLKLMAQTLQLSILNYI